MLPFRERIVHHDDGTVVFDPVTGRIRVLVGESALILEFLRDAIRAGTTDRDVLLALLREELAADADGSDASDAAGTEADDAGPAATARFHLLDWIDLARHVYA